MRLSRTTLVTGGVFLGAVALAGLLSSGRQESAAGEGGPAPVAVRIETLAARALEAEVSAGGFLRAREDVTVSAERSGRVVALPRPEGARVAVGDEIAVLEDTRAAADLAQARTALREAELDPRVPAGELAGVRAALERAEHEFALHHPRAPVDGVVEIHHVDVGEVVTPGAPLLDIVDPSVLILDVDVDAEIVPALAVGREVEVRVPALGEAGRRTGSISRLATRADRVTRRFRVEVALPAVTDGVAPPRPGMYAEAHLVLPPTAPAFYAPKAVVREREGEEGIFLAVDGHARWLPVRIEDVAGHPELCRVVEGAPPGAVDVIVAGFAGLRSGMPIEVGR